MHGPDFIPPPRKWERLDGTVDTRDLDSAEAVARLAVPGGFRHAEACRIHLSEGRKTIEIGSPAALPHAWAHLRRWRGEDPARTPCGEMEDEPAFARRGFMLDVSRCKVPTRERLARWVDLLAAFRLNELQLYTEHSFAYRGHETVWRDVSPLTPEDIVWLGDLCRGKGIELVPNQNCFGHFERWIEHPEYRKYAESPDGFTFPWGERLVGSVLKPDADSLELVTGLLDQLLPLFDSGRVNIGCDETFELGQGASRERCDREGTGRVYVEFVKRIMAHAIRNGKRPEFWGDIILKHPELLPELPREAVALEWGYEADHPFAEDCRKFAASGLEFVICPGSSSWRSFAGRTENMTANIRLAAAHAAEQGSAGLLLTDWGDCGHLQLEEVTWPALAWFGLNAWNPEAARMEDAVRWCDAEAFGAPGDTAAWLEAGRLSDALGWAPGNSNALFHLFMNTPGSRERSAGIPDARLTEALERLENLAPPSTRRGSWEQTLRNLRLSLLRERERREGRGLTADLEAEAMREHERLWRQRNREGGLAESLSMYTSTRNPNPDGEFS